ncbi:MAG: PKD domain-containing protein [Spirochaetaceae bacterium]|jgi:hypothetical protein|nr:PKD domain-containing protein [Spirochaetaceae bacterium]
MKNMKFNFLLAAAVLIATALVFSCEQYSGAKSIPEVEPEIEIESEAQIIGVKIISPPEITVYGRNMAFDPAGLAVGWLYDDASVDPMNDDEWEIVKEPDMVPEKIYKVEVRAVSVDYDPVSFYIMVMDSDRVLLSITASYAAGRTQDLGKDFDKTNLTVTGYFSDDTAQNLKSYASIWDYDRKWRGKQTLTAKVNGKTAAFTVTTRIGSGALVTVNNINWIMNNYQLNYCRPARIKGEGFNPQYANVKLAVRPSGNPSNVAYSDPNVVTLSYGPGGLTDADFAPAVAAFKPNQIGPQSVSFTVDGRDFKVDLFVIDVEPAVWFDYGYMRHAGNPNGVNWKSNDTADKGKYYARLGETLVIAPVRYLVGFNADHSDAAGTTYKWTVGGGASYTTTNNGEFLRVTPSTAGTYPISVTVTGKSYLDGNPIAKTAYTQLVCYANTDSFTPGTFGEALQPQDEKKLASVGVKQVLANGRMLRHMGPGQMCEGGTGIGWSLGSAGGYEVWTVPHQSSYVINGNAFGGWHEAGVVWVQEDRNGNGMPDETWYELRGGDEGDSKWRNYITRRYAVTYINNSEINEVNQYGQAIRDVYWADSRGRSHMIPGGFPFRWGVSDTGNWVTYTCTLLRDDGNIATADYGGLAPMPGYADAVGNTFSISNAMKADGTPIALSAVKFIKVQTGVFRYGGSYGDVSTEIKSADYLGVQTDFPDPEDS